MTEALETEADPAGDAPERDGLVATDGHGAPDLRDPDLYVNRELSWLDFNDRVLQLAEDESLPLIERLKFLAIFVTNLDEFFMIRVAGVHDQVDARIDARGPDGLSPTEVLRGIHDTVREQDRRHARQFMRTVMPELADHGIRVVTCDESGADAEHDRAALPRADLPRPDAAGGGRRAAVSLYLEPVAEPHRPPPRSRLRP